MTNPALRSNADTYAKLCGISLDLESPLGYGTDGVVWRSDRRSAVKAFERQYNYYCELRCYQRLEKNGVTSISGLAVPQLMGQNDDLRIVEMRLVTPPYLLDFGKAYLDRPPEYPPEMMEDWETGGLDLFGRRWPDVKSIVRRLKQYGIYYYDVKPGNINFGDFDEDE